MPDRLRKAREHAGLSQNDLAHDIGVSRNTVNNYERGRTNPRRPVILAWAVRCGVPVDWLWRGTDAGDGAATPAAPWHAAGVAGIR